MTCNIRPLITLTLVSASLTAFCFWCLANLPDPLAPTFDVGLYLLAPLGLLGGTVLLGVALVCWVVCVGELGWALAKWACAPGRRVSGWRKVALAGVLTLGLTTPSYGQDPGGFTNTTSLADLMTGFQGGLSGWFGGFGGELPVRDATTRSQTTITAIKTAAMLVDMLIQALNGGGPSNGSTGGLIHSQAEYGQAGSVLYGRYSPDLFMDTFKEDIIYRHGDWSEDETIRDHRRITTQMDLMWLLKMRQDAFVTDMERLGGIKDAIDGCEGRNCAIQATGAAMTEAAWQSLQQQQLAMTIANAQLIANAGEVNDVTQKRAMEKYFITNDGQPVRAMAWGNPGIY